MWTGQVSSTMPQQMAKYHLQRPPFDYDIACTFTDIPLYWEMMAADDNDCKDVIFVARRLRAIGVNSASCERLFSDIGYIHSDRRNRLPFNKVLDITKVRSNLKRSGARKNMDQMKRARTSATISIPSSTNTSVLTTNSDSTMSAITSETATANIADDITTDGAADSMLTIEHWDVLTSEWLEILEDEGEEEVSGGVFEYGCHPAEKRQTNGSCLHYLPYLKIVFCKLCL